MVYAKKDVQDVWSSRCIQEYTTTLVGEVIGINEAHFSEVIGSRGWR